MKPSLNSLYPSMVNDRNDKGTFLYHAPCDACGSKDNASVYLATDGTTNSWVQRECNMRRQMKILDGGPKAPSRIEFLMEN